ncbi:MULTISPECIES: ATP-grasp domain-containing protein [unclassified Nocardioides]|uniref:ATP-grasp domain-containing protein n=1 Tax=unclassified Nocardioides TaxID=2615069 RepID=UPI0000EB6187|nr:MULTISPECIES: ATP-grasp domain-containing protein [unclassified Nocardioides]ABL80558.1 protein of unknown function DUF201 [Nocardioides sp. JS614]
MTERAAVLKKVTEELGDRTLVWSGIRGDDIEPLRDVPQLGYSFSIAGAYNGRSDVRGLAYEQLTRVRVDPEVWDIDFHHHERATEEFRRGLLRSMSEPSALLPYRPSSFLSAIHFARQERCVNLGLFGAHQSAFEHKPFVESEVAQLGIPHIPWTYIADEEQPLARNLVSAGPLVLRRSRTSGGEGIVRVDSAAEIGPHWPKGTEEFVSVAPFIADTIPVNVGATVWRDSRGDDCVTVHHPSVQLIGIKSCVTREFGYCGNDFGAARDLDRSTIDRIEQSTKRVGRWLRGNGYIGTFGVDYLIKDGVPLFTEINARFQGSTYSSCRLSIEQGEACLMLEHVAAWLGLPMPESPSLYERTRAVRDLANLAVHWTGREAATVNATALFSVVMDDFDPKATSDSVVATDVANEPGSLVGRFNVGRRVTDTGYDLAPELDRLIDRWRRSEEAS